MNELFTLGPEGRYNWYIEKYTFCFLEGRRAKGRGGERGRGMNILFVGKDAQMGGKIEVSIGVELVYYPPKTR